MMEITAIISLGSLLVAGALALLQWRKYTADKRIAERAHLVDEFKMPAERDSIIVAGAQQAVDLLRSSLAQATIDIERLKLDLTDMRNQRDNFEAMSRDTAARVTYLERELARLSYTVEGTA